MAANAIIFDREVPNWVRKQACKSACKSEKSAEKNVTLAVPAYDKL